MEYLIKSPIVPFQSWALHVNFRAKPPVSNVDLFTSPLQGVCHCTHVVATIHKPRCYGFCTVWCKRMMPICSDKVTTWNHLNNDNSLQETYIFFQVVKRYYTLSCCIWIKSKISNELSCTWVISLVQWWEEYHFITITF